MERISQDVANIEYYLKEVLTNSATEAKVLLESMQYAILNGGKRLRPLLSIAGGLLSQASIETSIYVGVAIELIHGYSLIHDDLPAMDNDDFRRGKPACHKKYGEAIAILAGDSLQSLAFELLSSDKLVIDLAVKLDIINLVARSSGLRGMAGGQAIDVLNSGKSLSLEQLIQMHKLKTGSLIATSILAGYLCGVKEPNLKHKEFFNLEVIALKIGLLFQIIDDILDITQSTATLGKTANKDQAQAKATYVTLLGLDKASLYAKELYIEIYEQLHLFPNCKYLAFLIDTIYNRTN